MSIFHCFQSHVTSGALKTHRTHLLHSTSFCFEIAGTFVSLSLRHKFRDHMPHIQSKVHDLPLFGCKYCREKWSSTSPTSHPRKAENKRASHKKKSISESISIYKSYLKNTYLSPIIPSFIEVSPGPHPPASFRATLVSSSSLEVGDAPLISRCQTWGKPREKWRFQLEKHGKNMGNIGKSP